MGTVKSTSMLSLTRRRFLKVSAMTAVPLLAPGPLRAAAQAASATAPVAIRRGGTIVAARQFPVPTLDPHLSNDAAVPVLESIYNSLVRFELVNPKTWEHKVVGDLAESWEQPDPRTYIFKLKQGVTFHDGSEFTAVVAAWNMLRLRDHPKSQKKTQLQVVESVEAVGRSTLRVRLKEPNAAFLQNLAFVYGAPIQMVSKAAMEKLGEDGFARAPVGTGAFKFKQWITDDRVILQRNPDYFEKGADGKPLPYLDGAVFRYIPDPAVALVDMRFGSMHVLENLPAKDVPVVKANPSLDIAEMPWAGLAYFLVGFNTNTVPFKDVRVRQAALHGIDREGMAKALGYGVGVPHYYPKFMSGAIGYDEGVKKYEYNPAKVKELLRDAGYPDGISIDLKVISREPDNTIGEFAQQMWTAVGIRTKLVSLERLTWINAMRAKDFEASFWRGTFLSVVDPEILKSRVMCGGDNNWGQWCDPEIDRLMLEGGAISDTRKRHETYRQVLRLMQERAYLGSGIRMPLVTAYRKTVQGLKFNYQVPEFRTCWLKA